MRWEAFEVSQWASNEEIGDFESESACRVEKWRLFTYMTAYHTFFFNLIPFANKLLHLQQQQQQQEQYLSCMSIIDLDHLKVIRLFQLQCPVICLNLFDFTQFQGWLEWLGHFQFTRHTHTHIVICVCVWTKNGLMLKSDYVIWCEIFKNLNIALKGKCLFLAYSLCHLPLPSKY